MRFPVITSLELDAATTPRSPLSCTTQFSTRLSAPPEMMIPLSALPMSQLITSIC